ncbi:MAG: heavy-metal-associated domain-containing protein [Bacteroidota bacterium]|jgi:copper chaperone|nr:heavy-metal-associated domain-containing protein [Bacteroidota bacterium]
MKTLKFKTNVNCGGCIATVTPHLDQLEGIVKWSVDTSNPLKVLTVETSGLDADVIVETLKNAGYKADLMASE